MSAPVGPTQAELRAERLAEEEALRPSLPAAVAAAAVWLVLFTVLSAVLPDVALQVGGLASRAFVPTLPLDPRSIVVGGLFLCALATARAPGGPGIVARDFVRYALGLGLVTAATVALQVFTAFVVGGPTRPNDGLATALVMAASLLGVACGLGILGLGLLWLAVAHEVAVLPRGEPREELARVAHLAAPLVVGVLLWTSRYAHHFGATPLVVVPAHVAAALTLSGVVVVLAAWLRLRRPAAYGRGPTE